MKTKVATDQNKCFPVVRKKLISASSTIHSINVPVNDKTIPLFSLKILRAVSI